MRPKIPTVLLACWCFWIIIRTLNQFRHLFDAPVANAVIDPVRSVLFLMPFSPMGLDLGLVMLGTWLNWRLREEPTSPHALTLILIGFYLFWKSFLGNLVLMPVAYAGADRWNDAFLRWLKVSSKNPFVFLDSIGGTLIVTITTIYWLLRLISGRVRTATQPQQPPPLPMN